MVKLDNILQHQLFSVITPGIAFSSGSTILAWFAGELAFIAHFIGFLIVTSCGMLNKDPAHRVGSYLPSKIRLFLTKEDPLAIDSYFKFSAGLLGVIGLVIGTTPLSLIAVLSSSVLIIYGISDIQFVYVKHRAKSEISKSIFIRILREPNLYLTLGLLGLSFIAGIEADLTNTFASLDQFMKNLPIYANIPLALISGFLAIRHSIYSTSPIPNLPALSIYTFAALINLVCSYHNPLMTVAFLLFLIGDLGLIKIVRSAQQQSKSS